MIKVFNIIAVQPSDIIVPEKFYIDNARNGEREGCRMSAILDSARVWRPHKEIDYKTSLATEKLTVCLGVPPSFPRSPVNPKALGDLIVDREKLQVISERNSTNVDEISVIPNVPLPFPRHYIIGKIYENSSMVETYGFWGDTVHPIYVVIHHSYPGQPEISKEVELVKSISLAHPVSSGFPNFGPSLIMVGGSVGALGIGMLILLNRIAQNARKIHPDISQISSKLRKILSTSGWLMIAPNSTFFIFVIAGVYLRDFPWFDSPGYPWDFLSFLPLTAFGGYLIKERYVLLENWYGIKNRDM